MDSARTWIQRLDLKPHPEGGFFRETYVSGESVSLDSLPGSRPLTTAIYYLLAGKDKSRLHRLKSDELWHFYQGDSLYMHLIHPDGRYEQIRLGAQLDQEEQLQAMVPAGVWFGAELAHPDTFALVGCTVSPGFAFEDFELGKRKALLQEYPEHKDLIEALTRPD